MATSEANKTELLSIVEKKPDIDDAKEKRVDENETVSVYEFISEVNFKYIEFISESILCLRIILLYTKIS